MEKKKCIISFQSQTYSMKAGMLLAEHSIKSKSISLGNNSSHSGCTVGLEINCKDFLDATKLLNAHQIKYGVPK